MATKPRCSVFNGNVLPNQPSELDATKYPNWLILYGTNSTTGAKQYIWLACSKPFLKYAEGVYVYPADADIIGYGANASTCTWSLGTITKEEGPADYYTFSGTYVWSYQPIYSHSDPAVVAHPAGDMVTDWDAEEPTITALTGAGTAESPTGYWQGDTPTALTCTATVGDGGTLSYKWYRNGSYVGGGSSYTPTTATAGQFVYHCEVTNTLTGASGFSDIDTVQSDSLVLVVTAKENEDGGTEGDTDRETAAKRTKAYVMGYVLRQCGVPMAELIAEMLCKVKKTASLYLYGTPSTTGNIGLRNGETVTYYKGHVAPELPMYDNAKYNKAMMTVHRGSKYTSGKVWAMNGVTFGLGGGVNGSEWRVRCNSYVMFTQGRTSGTEWLEGGAKDEYSEVSDIESVEWANFDIINQDGTVYLPATEPIPVYGIVDTINGIPIYDIKE